MLTFIFVCMVGYTLHSHWVFRAILLSGDVETNPGPDALSFCSWNLNSIIAHDFLRISLLEAYNSVFSYDLIGIVETHIDSTVDEDKLALDGYRFIKNNHPQDVKRGGVGLYVKESLPSKDRFDLVTLPECVVSEIQINRKKYFFVVIYRSPSQDQMEFDDFTINFEMLLSNLHAENPHSGAVWPGWQSGDRHPGPLIWKVEKNHGPFLRKFEKDRLHKL